MLANNYGGPRLSIKIELLLYFYENMEKHRGTKTLESCLERFFSLWLMNDKTLTANQNPLKQQMSIKETEGYVALVWTLG